jgi:benzoate/toluate 1,2-dioxygenase subunit beta
MVVQGATAADQSLEQLVQRFLHREARLLDRCEYEEWLSLFTDDAVYWVPAGAEEPNPSSQVSLVYDDRKRLELRLARLTGGFAHAQEPPSRVYRSVTNIEIEALREAEIHVESVMIAVEVRMGTQNVFGARCRHVLRPEAGDFRISRKEVWLANREAVFDNLTFVL